ncbi:hypothetical protein chiPu_0020843, partial [Chiloscyllium punctatum]|nr:hypothetical protein [Chiloscyllium punctatum]
SSGRMITDVQLAIFANMLGPQHCNSVKVWTNKKWINLKDGS